MKTQIKLLLFGAFIVSVQLAQAQTFLDATIGTGKQDNISLNLAARKQFSDQFRAGIELQVGSSDYRFIGAKRIDEGISTTLSLPTSIRLYAIDKMRLDFYSRVGLRYQVVSSSYEVEEDLEDNASWGFNIEPGLSVTYMLTDKLNIQSGVTLPNFFEVTPTFNYENNITNLFMNVGYQVSEGSTLIFKSNTGPAAGSDGNSQKYTWSVQAGFRFTLNGKGSKAALMMDPTF